eukprot:gene12764-8703_t
MYRARLVRKEDLVFASISSRAPYDFSRATLPLVTARSHSGWSVGSDSPTLYGQRLFIFESIGTFIWFTWIFSNFLYYYYYFAVQTNKKKKKKKKKKAAPASTPYIYGSGVPRQMWATARLHSSTVYSLYVVHCCCRGNFFVLMVGSRLLPPSLSTQTEEKAQSTPVGSVPPYLSSRRSHDGQQARKRTEGEREESTVPSPPVRSPPAALRMGSARRHPTDGAALVTPSCSAVVLPRLVPFPQLASVHQQHFQQIQRSFATPTTPRTRWYCSRDLRQPLSQYVVCLLWRIAAHLRLTTSSSSTTHILRRRSTLQWNRCMSLFCLAGYANDSGGVSALRPAVCIGCYPPAPPVVRGRLSLFAVLGSRASTSRRIASPWRSPHRFLRLYSPPTRLSPPCGGLLKGCAEQNALGAFAASGGCYADDLLALYLTAAIVQSQPQGSSTPKDASLPSSFSALCEDSAAHDMENVQQEEARHVLMPHSAFPCAQCWAHVTQVGHQKIQRRLPPLQLFLQLRHRWDLPYEVPHERRGGKEEQIRLRSGVWPMGLPDIPPGVELCFAMISTPWCTPWPRDGDQVEPAVGRLHSPRNEPGAGGGLPLHEPTLYDKTNPMPPSYNEINNNIYIYIYITATWMTWQRKEKQKKREREREREGEEERKKKKLRAGRNGVLTEGHDCTHIVSHRTSFIAQASHMWGLVLGSGSTTSTIAPSPRIGSTSAALLKALPLTPPRPPQQPVPPSANTAEHTSCRLDAVVTPRGQHLIPQDVPSVGGASAVVLTEPNPFVEVRPCIAPAVPVQGVAQPLPIPSEITTTATTTIPPLITTIQKTRPLKEHQSGALTFDEEPSRMAAEGGEGPLLLPPPEISRPQQTPSPSPPVSSCRAPGLPLSQQEQQLGGESVHRDRPAPLPATGAGKEASAPGAAAPEGACGALQPAEVAAVRIFRAWKQQQQQHFQQRTPLRVGSQSSPPPASQLLLFQLEQRFGHPSTSTAALLVECLMDLSAGAGGRSPFSFSPPKSQQHRRGGESVRACESFGFVGLSLPNSGAVQLLRTTHRQGGGSPRGTPAAEEEEEDADLIVDVPAGDPPLVEGRRKRRRSHEAPGSLSRSVPERRFETWRDLTPPPPSQTEGCHAYAFEAVDLNADTISEWILLHLPRLCTAAAAMEGEADRDISGEDEHVDVKDAKARTEPRCPAVEPSKFYLHAGGMYVHPPARSPTPPSPTPPRRPGIFLLVPLLLSLVPLFLRHGVLMDVEDVQRWLLRVFLGLAERLGAIVLPGAAPASASTCSMKEKKQRTDEKARAMEEYRRQVQKAHTSLSQHLERYKQGESTTILGFLSTEFVALITTIQQQEHQSSLFLEEQQKKKQNTNRSSGWANRSSGSVTATATAVGVLRGRTAASKNHRARRAAPLYTPLSRVMLSQPQPQQQGPVSTPRPWSSAAAASGPGASARRKPPFPPPPSSSGDQSEALAASHWHFFTSSTVAYVMATVFLTTRSPTDHQEAIYGTVDHSPSSPSSRSPEPRLSRLDRSRTSSSASSLDCSDDDDDGRSSRSLFSASSLGIWSASSSSLSCYPDTRSDEERDIQQQACGAPSPSPAPEAGACPPPQHSQRRRRRRRRQRQREKAAASLRAKQTMEAVTALLQLCCALQDHPLYRSPMATPLPLDPSFTPAAAAAAAANEPTPAPPPQPPASPSGSSPAPAPAPRSNAASPPCASWLERLAAPRHAHTLPPPSPIRKAPRTSRPATMRNLMPVPPPAPSPCSPVDSVAQQAHAEPLTTTDEDGTHPHREQSVALLQARVRLRLLHERRLLRLWRALLHETLQWATAVGDSVDGAAAGDGCQGTTGGDGAPCLASWKLGSFSAAAGEGREDEDVGGREESTEGGAAVFRPAPRAIRLLFSPHLAWEHVLHSRGRSTLSLRLLCTIMLCFLMYWCMLLLLYGHIACFIIIIIIIYLFIHLLPLLSATNTNLHEGWMRIYQISIFLPISATYHLQKKKTTQKGSLVYFVLPQLSRSRKKELSRTRRRFRTFSFPLSLFFFLDYWDLILPSLDHWYISIRRSPQAYPRRLPVLCFHQLFDIYALDLYIYILTYTFYLFYYYYYLDLFVEFCRTHITPFPVQRRRLAHRKHIPTAMLSRGPGPGGPGSSSIVSASSSSSLSALTQSGNASHIPQSSSLRPTPSTTPTRRSIGHPQAPAGMPPGPARPQDLLAHHASPHLHRRLDHHQQQQPSSRGHPPSPTSLLTAHAGSLPPRSSPVRSVQDPRPQPEHLPRHQEEAPPSGGLPFSSLPPPHRRSTSRGRGSSSSSPHRLSSGTAPPPPRTAGSGGGGSSSGSLPTRSSPNPAPQTTRAAFASSRDPPQQQRQPSPNRAVNFKLPPSVHSTAPTSPVSSYTPAGPPQQGNPAAPPTPTPTPNGAQQSQVIAPTDSGPLHVSRPASYAALPPPPPPNPQRHRTAAKTASRSTIQTEAPLAPLPASLLSRYFAQWHAYLQRQQQHAHLRRCAVALARRQQRGLVQRYLVQWLGALQQQTRGEWRAVMHHCLVHGQAPSPTLTPPRGQPSARLLQRQVLLPGPNDALQLAGRYFAYWRRYLRLEAQRKRALLWACGWRCGENTNSQPSSSAESGDAQRNPHRTPWALTPCRVAAAAPGGCTRSTAVASSPPSASPAVFFFAPLASRALRQWMIWALKRRRRLAADVEATCRAEAAEARLREQAVAAATAQRESNAALEQLQKALKENEKALADMRAALVDRDAVLHQAEAERRRLRAEVEHERHLREADKADRLQDLAALREEFEALQAVALAEQQQARQLQEAEERRRQERLASASPCGSISTPSASLVGEDVEAASRRSPRHFPSSAFRKACDAYRDEQETALEEARGWLVQLTCKLKAWNAMRSPPLEGGAGPPPPLTGGDAVGAASKMQKQHADSGGGSFSTSSHSYNSRRSVVALSKEAWQEGLRLLHGLQYLQETTDQYFPDTRAAQEQPTAQQEGEDRRGDALSSPHSPQQQQQQQQVPPYERLLQRWRQMHHDLTGLRFAAENALTLLSPAPHRRRACEPPGAPPPPLPPGSTSSSSSSSFADPRVSCLTAEVLSDTLLLHAQQVTYAYELCCDALQLPRLPPVLDPSTPEDHSKSDSNASSCSAAVAAHLRAIQAAGREYAEALQAKENLQEMLLVAGAAAPTHPSSTTSQTESMRPQPQPQPPRWFDVCGGVVVMTRQHRAAHTLLFEFLRLFKDPLRQYTMRSKGTSQRGALKSGSHATVRAQVERWFGVPYAMAARLVGGQAASAFSTTPAWPLDSASGDTDLPAGSGDRSATPTMVRWLGALQRAVQEEMAAVHRTLQHQLRSTLQAAWAEEQQLASPSSSSSSSAGDGRAVLSVSPINEADFAAAGRMGEEEAETTDDGVKGWRYEHHGSSAAGPLTAAVTSAAAAGAAAPARSSRTLKRAVFYKHPAAAQDASATLKGDPEEEEESDADESSSLVTGGPKTEKVPHLADVLRLLSHPQQVRLDAVIGVGSSTPVPSFPQQTQLYLLEEAVGRRDRELDALRAENRSLRAELVGMVADTGEDLALIKEHLEQRFVDREMVEKEREAWETYVQQERRRQQGAVQHLQRALEVSTAALADTMRFIFPFTSTALLSAASCTSLSPSTRTSAGEDGAAGGPSLLLEGPVEDGTGDGPGPAGLRVGDNELRMGVLSSPPSAAHLKRLVLLEVERMEEEAEAAQQSSPPRKEGGNCKASMKRRQRRTADTTLPLCLSHLRRGFFGFWVRLRGELRQLHAEAFNSREAISLLHDNFFAPRRGSPGRSGGGGGGGESPGPRHGSPTPAPPRLEPSPAAALFLPQVETYLLQRQAELAAQQKALAAECAQQQLAYTQHLAILQEENAVLDARLRQQAEEQHRWREKVAAIQEELALQHGPGRATGTTAGAAPQLPPPPKEHRRRLLEQQQKEKEKEKLQLKSSGAEGQNEDEERRGEEGYPPPPLTEGNNEESGDQPSPLGSYAAAFFSPHLHAAAAAASAPPGMITLTEASKLIAEVLRHATGGGDLLQCYARTLEEVLEVYRSVQQSLFYVLQAYHQKFLPMVAAWAAAGEGEVKDGPLMGSQRSTLPHQPISISGISANTVPPPFCAVMGTTQGFVRTVAEQAQLLEGLDAEVRTLWSRHLPALLRPII